MLRKKLQRVFEMAGGAGGALLISALLIVAAVGPGATEPTPAFELGQTYV